MENWNEIRTAYELLRCGTVSGTADVLNIHRATVIRHIDALEALLGEKLFIRSAKGYVATEVGVELLDVAAQADERFRQFATRVQKSLSQQQQMQLPKRYKLTRKTRKAQTQR